MRYAESGADQVPISLLLEADPSEENIRVYLNGSWCFSASDKEAIVGVCVIKTIACGVAEIFNVSVLPDRQQSGIGSELLAYSLRQMRKKSIKRLELGTGTFGYQLAYYQRHGFRVESVVRDHFLINYSQPIYEDGIQHRDMLRLIMELG